MSKNKKLLNIRKPKNYQKNLQSELESDTCLREFWVKIGSLQTDLKQYKLMCSKVIEMRPINSMYFTHEELFQYSGLSLEKFHKRCRSWYISLEKDDWQPCIELCGLCSIMKDKFGKYWYPIDKQWKK